MNSHQPVNPYIAGSPVTGTEMFYGREDVFSFIQRNLIGRHRDTPIVLYGQRRTGKTSVLYQLHRHLDPSYRCIFIDLHGLNLNGWVICCWESPIPSAGACDATITSPWMFPIVPPSLLTPGRHSKTIFLDAVWSALARTTWS